VIDMPAAGNIVGGAKQAGTHFSLFAVLSSTHGIKQRRLRATKLLTPTRFIAEEALPVVSYGD
jgi:hypothetical protein